MSGRWRMPLGFGIGMALGVGAAVAQAPLYTCEGTASDAAGIGVALCDATPTEELLRRAESDNLQRRSGVLVADVDQDGVAASAGLEPGDLVYRIGGTDVADTPAAVDALSAVGSTSDTVVNFLRRGRPYRVKLRLELTDR